MANLSAEERRALLAEIEAGSEPTEVERAMLRPLPTHHDPRVRTDVPGIADQARAPQTWLATSGQPGIMGHRSSHIIFDDIHTVDADDDWYAAAMTMYRQVARQVFGPRPQITIFPPAGRWHRDRPRRTLEVVPYGLVLERIESWFRLRQAVGWRAWASVRIHQLGDWIDD